MNSDDQFDKRKNYADDRSQEPNRLVDEPASEALAPSLQAIVGNIDPHTVRPELKELALKLVQSPNRGILQQYWEEETRLNYLDGLESRGYKRELSPDNLSSIVVDLCSKIESGEIAPTAGIRDLRTIIYNLHPDITSMNIAEDTNQKALFALFDLSSDEINLSDAKGMISPEEFDSDLKVLNEKIIEAASVVLKNNSLKDQK
jgi:Fe-S-cluster formation regulator IscX/YfhJ